MRLLDTETCNFVERDPKDVEYAILSHTWDSENGEQTYKQLRKIQKRYVNERQTEYPESVIPHSSSKLSPNTRTLAVTPTSLNERTPLLGLAASDQLSSMEQGILPVTHHQTSPLDMLQKFIARLSRRMWGLLLLVAFVLPRYWTERIQNTHHADRSSTPSELPSPQGDTLVTPPLVSDSSTPESSQMRQSEMASRAQARIWDDPELSPKIREACAIARADGYRYIWIDSCCIDKSSSSELSEAINSMYAWYSLAHVCYAYLADVPSRANHCMPSSKFRSSRWFKRGWTLQELIAPLNVMFLSEHWMVIGPKYALVDLVAEITGITEDALLHVEPLDHFSVAQRLSWAAGRETTRVEDEAYSLLGIFGINIPTLYGEGRRAFRRLQEEIMQRVPEQSQSLFTWGSVWHHPELLNRRVIILCLRSTQPSPLADTPRLFCQNVRAIKKSSHIFGNFQLEYLRSPYGIRTQFQMLPFSTVFPSASLQHSSKEMKDAMRFSKLYIALLGCEYPTARPGYLLGRLYWTSTSSDVEILSTADLSIGPNLCFSLISLSPQIIQRCRPWIKLKTVHIPHEPNPVYQPRITRHPCSTMMFGMVVLKKTRGALQAKGFAVDLRGPLDESNMHHLTLYHPQYAIRTRLYEMQRKIVACRPELEMTRPRVGPVRQFRLVSNFTTPRRASTGTSPPIPWSWNIRWELDYPKLSDFNVYVGGWPSANLIFCLNVQQIAPTSCMILYIDVLKVLDTSPAPSAPSPVGLLHGQGRGLPRINVDGSTLPNASEGADGPAGGLRTRIEPTEEA